MKNWIIALAYETNTNIAYAPITISEEGNLIPVPSTSNAFTLDSYEMATDLVIAYGELYDIEITLPSGYNRPGSKDGLFITLMERDEWSNMDHDEFEYKAVFDALAKNHMKNHGDFPEDMVHLDDYEFIKRHAGSKLFLKFDAERFGEAELERLGRATIDWNQFVV